MNAVTETRLQQEARDMKRQPLFGQSGIRDITHDFINSSKQLRSGELVKDEYFTLFEAVGALEIMDPKMDSGCIPPGDSFEPDFDVCGGLSAAKVLWIMDELLRLEMSFHDGYPVSQNLFTSLHIMRLIHPDNKAPYHFRFEESLGKTDANIEEQLVHVALRAYCVAVVKSIALALDMIQSSTFYEEEDFVTYLFGRDLLPNLSVREVSTLLLEAATWVEQSSLPAEMKNALKQRLAIRQDLLLALEEGHEGQWRKLKNKVEAMDMFHGMVEPLSQAFSDKVQRQLATSTPPRPMPQLSWQDACRKWRQLCDDVLTIFDLTSTGVRESPQCLQRATWAFAYRLPPPTTFARAKMQEVLTSEDSVAGDVAHFDLMLADIRDLVLAGDPLADPASFQVEVPTDPRHRASRLIEDFMQRTFGEYLNIYRMVCQNRCRMRRTFTQAVPLLDEIETDAREVDQQLNEIIVPRQVQDEAGNWLLLKPLTLWVRHHKLRIMEWIIQLGFETDLYLPREMSNMYLTLHEIVGSQRQQLLHVQCFVDDRARYISRTSGRNYQDQCRISKNWIRSLLLQSTVMYCISDALCDLYALLERLGIVDTMRKPYEHDQLQYEARMKPFLSLVHDRLPDSNFFENRKKLQVASVSDTCVKAAVSVKQGRESLAELKLMEPAQAKVVGTEDHWRQEIKSLETVCVAVSVASSQLQRLYEKHGTPAVQEYDQLKQHIEALLPSVETRYHTWWVVPQIKEKK